MIEQLLSTTIGPLLAGRLYPDVGPDNATLPYAVYSQVGGKTVGFIEGGPVGKKNARIQFVVWSKTRKEAMQLIRQIEDAAVSAPLLGMVEGGAIARYDEVTALRGAMQDYSFWFDD